MNERIGKRLMEQGLITQTQLGEALEYQADHGGKLAGILISLGYLTPDEFLKFLAAQPGVSSVDLASYELSSDLVSLIPKEFALKHEVIPIDRLGGVLTVGMACPLDSAAIAQLETITGMQVKPLLCSAADVRSAIRRYHAGDGVLESETSRMASIEGLRSPMRLSHVAGVLRRIDSLPALPETVARVREAMTDPRSSITDVAEVITLDPPIAAKLLSVANSAAYGFPQQVDTVQLGVSLLGLRETYSLVLSCAVLDIFKKSEQFDYRVFWVESLCCAAAARIVSKAAGQRDLFGVFCAGLLHDLGRVALSEVAHRAYAEIDYYLPPDSLIEAEEEHVGLSHTEAGYELATHWNLPPEIAEPIRFHHRPWLASTAKVNVAVTALASLMTRAQGKSIDENEGIFSGYESTLALLRIDDEIAEAMLAEFLDARTDSFRDVLG